jgi:flavin reductase (DIM6/NTAB) family NADH-FMN oxidoreductase RutF
MTLASIESLFGHTDRPLWLLTAQAGQRRGGLIAACVVEAGIAPQMPRVLVGLARQHATWELVEASGAFALHLLAVDQIDLVWRFGLESGRDVDKFAGIALPPGPGGSPVLTDLPGWLACRVEASMDGGDRTFYLAEVLDGGMRDSRPILTMQKLLALASPERLQQLREALAHDAAVDAPLIEAWRAAKP